MSWVVPLLHNQLLELVGGRQFVVAEINAIVNRYGR
jgi:hypothetical protein